MLPRGVCCLLLCGLLLPAQDPAVAGPAVEYGTVRWRRDFAAARTQAKAQDRPLLVLFQEVPG